MTHLKQNMMTIVVPLTILSILLMQFTAHAQENNRKKNSDFMIEDVTRDENRKETKEKEAETFNIVVTAQKRKEKVQDLAGSVSILNSKQIEDAKIESTNEIHNYIPNFASYDFGTGFSYYSVRGQSNISHYSNAVGIYIDDIPSIRSVNVTDSELYEIERIEILRGAQGNLYGLNSTGGVINIITKKPDNFWTAKSTGTFGNYNRRSYKAALNGPVIKDKLYVSFTGMYSTIDSFIEEEGADTHKKTVTEGRYQMRWFPVDALEVMFTINLNNRDQDYATYTIKDGDPWTVANKGMTEKNDVTGDSESLRIKYSGTWFEATSVTAHSETTLDYEATMDLASGKNLFAMFSYEKGVNWTQELRLNSKDNNAPFQWIVGTFYNKTTNDIDNNYPLDEGYTYTGVASGTYIDDITNAELNGVTASVYTQVKYIFFKRLGLTGGLRYDHDYREIVYHHNQYGTVTGEYDDSESWDVISPRAAMDFRISDSVMTYVSAARGYKAGGYYDGSDEAEDAAFDPEYSWTYEVGIKTNWLGNRIIANIAGFYSTIDEIQVMLSDSDTHRIYFENAAQARTSGIELEIMARPVTGFDIMASCSYLSSEFTEHDIKNYEGNKIPLAPEYQAALALQYTTSAGFFIRGEGNWNGKTYFDEANSLKQDSYMILNTKAGYRSEHFSFNFFLNNALDQEYYTLLMDWTDCEDTSNTFTAGLLGAARTFGLEATLEF